MPDNPTPEELAALRVLCETKGVPAVRFIAAARTALPRLLDALEAERAKVKSLEEELAGVGSDLNRALTEIP